MKKAFITAVILAAAIGAGMLVYSALVSECDDRYEQYELFVSAIDRSRFSSDGYYRWETGEQMTKRQADVAWACLSEKKPERAAAMYRLLIDSANKPQYALERRLPRSSAQVKLVAVYYGLLAQAYDMQGDEQQKAAALKKQAEFEAEADRFRKRR